MAVPRRRALPDAALAELDPAAANRIEIVLPLKPSNDTRGSDLARVRDGVIPSFNRFCDPRFIARFTIVVPRADMDQVAALFEISDIELTVLAEEDLLPGPVAALPRRGWYVQQLLKIAYAGICRTAFYLTLDADCFLVDMLDERILIDGRAPLHQEKIDTHLGWWIASAGVLQTGNAVVDASAPVIGVTPAFLHASTMCGMMARLSALGVAHDLDWAGYLAAHANNSDTTWTEYTLYWTWLVDQGDPYSLHYSRPVYLFCTAVWQALTRLTPVARHAELFCILQSTGVAAPMHARFVSRQLAESETPDARTGLGLQGGYRYLDPTALRALLVAGPALVWQVSFGATGACAIGDALGLRQGWRYCELIDRFPWPLPLAAPVGFRALYLFDDPVEAVIQQAHAADPLAFNRNNNLNFAPVAFEALSLDDYVASGQDLLNLTDHFTNWTDPAGALGKADYPVLILRTRTLAQHCRSLSTFLGLPEAQRASLRETLHTPISVDASDDFAAAVPALRHMYAPLAARIDAFPDAALWDHRTGQLCPLAPD